MYLPDKIERAKSKVGELEAELQYAKDELQAWKSFMHRFGQIQFMDDTLPMLDVLGDVINIELYSPTNKNSPDRILVEKDKSNGWLDLSRWVAWKYVYADGWVENTGVCPENVDGADVRFYNGEIHRLYQLADLDWSIGVASYNIVAYKQLGE